MSQPAPSVADVTVISVAYNSIDVLPEMAATLPAGTPLIIVDNGADDGLRQWARDQGHHLIVPDRNLGFGGGCNLGAAAATTDFVFFLNPDSRLDPDAIDRLLDAARRHPDAIGFAPEIRRESGAVFRVRPSRLARPGDLPRRGAKPDREIDLPSMNGAAMFIRRSAFDRVGGFDPEIFLFFEDDDLSLRLAEVGRLVYVPTAKLVHASGGSTAASDALSRFKGYHYARSHYLVRRKHGGALAGLRVGLSVLRRLLSLRILTRRDKRHEALGQWAGLRDALAGRTPPAT